MSTVEHRPETANTVFIFPSDLGWMGVIVADGAVRQLTFVHPSEEEAKEELDPDLLEHARPGKHDDPLVQRLQKYASGMPDSFRDVPVDYGRVGDFRHRVFEQCREIPYGHTISYAELAARAGAPRAARAVGSCMAANKIPLIVPCHRVVGTNGKIGAYSALGGGATKQRILGLESRGIDLELNADSGQNTAP